MTPTQRAALEAVAAGAVPLRLVPFPWRDLDRALWYLEKRTGRETKTRRLHGKTAASLLRARWIEERAPFGPRLASRSFALTREGREALEKERAR